MTELVRHADEYLVPDEWRDPEWITNFNNFPDPIFTHLEGEYDWGIKSKSLVFSYVKHLAGAMYAINLFNGFPKPPEDPHKNQVHSYFLFAVGAATLLNEPDRMRRPYEKTLCGSDVINYVNKVPLPDLFPNDWSDSKLFQKLFDRKHILPMKYSALFSRTFNQTSGVLDEHQLKIKSREPKLFKCPNCKAIIALNSSNVYTIQNKIAYTVAEQKLERQKERQKEYESR